MSEIWKDVPGFEGRYQVSTLGRVKSFTDWKHGALLKATLNKRGRFQVALYGRADGRRVTVRRIHQLVAWAFLGPMPEWAELVRHKDGNKTNDRVGNLAYGTYKDNDSDKDIHGTRPVGEAHYAHKLTARQVLEMRAEKFYHGIDVHFAHKFGISSVTAGKARRGETWKSLAI